MKSINLCICSNVFMFLLMYIKLYLKLDRYKYKTSFFMFNSLGYTLIYVYV